MASETSDHKSKTLKDVNSLDELDLDNLNLIMGDTPKDITQTCLQICKDYLSGNWDQQTVNTIEVRRITGGLTNQLYYCGLLKPLIGSDVPQEVAIRLYGKKYFSADGSDGDNDRLSDTILALMVSDNNLGPKIYGLFEHGQIQHYYHHRQFVPEEQNNPKLVREVFQKLARFHAMDVPIKRVNWFAKLMDDSYKYLFDGDIPFRQWIVDYDCKLLQQLDFAAELEYIKDIIIKSESPLIFTHNDYRSSNILITQNNTNTDNQIVVCDFESCGYGSRGMDFCPLFSEWGRKQWDWRSVDGLPQDDSVFNPLIQLYIDECVRIHGKGFSDNPINSLPHIEIAENSLKNYLIMKDRLKLMKVIE